MEYHGHSRAAHFIKKRITVEPWPKSAFQLPPAQSHRGFTGSGCQENTIPAFRAAKERGALMFECDVRLSGDGVPVLFHDEDLVRLGNSKARVLDLSAAELAKKTGAPSLEEVLCSPEVPALINIEIKSNKPDDALERRVFAVLKKTKQQHRVMISSFNPVSIWKFSQWSQNIPLGLLVGFNTAPWLREMWSAPLLSFHMLNMDNKLLTDSEIQFWTERNIPLGAWTVNDPERAQELLRLGVKTIISDN